MNWRILLAGVLTAALVALVVQTTWQTTAPDLTGQAVRPDAHASAPPPSQGQPAQRSAADPVRAIVELRDQEDRPIVDATVEAWFEPGASATVTPRDHAQFAVPRGDLLLFASAPSHLPSLQRIRIDRPTTVVRLARIRTLDLTILDGMGSACAGATARLVDRNGARLQRTWIPEAAALANTNSPGRSELLQTAPPELDEVTAMLASQPSDRAGRVRWDQLAEASVCVELKAPAPPSSNDTAFRPVGNGWYRSSPIQVPDAGRLLTIRLRRGGTVRGRLGETGFARCRGEAILRTNVPGGDGVMIQDIEQKVRIEPDGAFRFDNVQPGSKTVTVSSRPEPWTLVYADAAFSLAPGEDQDLGQLRPPPGSVRVLVRATDAGTGREVTDLRACWQIHLTTNPGSGPILSEMIHEFGSEDVLTVRGLRAGLVHASASVERGSQLPDSLHLVPTATMSQEVEVGSVETIELRAVLARRLPTRILLSSSAASATGTLTDTASSATHRLSFRQVGGNTLEATASLPELARTYDLSCFTDEGATGTVAWHRVQAVGGRPIRETMSRAAAVRMTLGLDGSRRVGVGLRGPGRQQVFWADDSGLVRIPGLRPDTEYELTAYTRELKELSFAATNSRTRTFRTGAGGTTERLGELQLQR